MCDHEKIGVFGSGGSLCKQHSIFKYRTVIPIELADCIFGGVHVIESGCSS